jgi:alkylhydroperoxidase family enzyme
MNRRERRALFEGIVRDVAEGEGRLALEMRRAAVAGEPLKGAVGELVERIRHASHLVTDQDVEAARGEGHDDDELYELTVATALGQSRERLRAVLRALGRGG